MSAEDTYNAMQVAMVRANVTEDEETTMARYLRILNYQLSNEVNLFPYNSMMKLLHLTIKVEKKMKNRYNNGWYNSSNSSNGASRWRTPTYTREVPDAKETRESSHPAVMAASGT